MTDPKAETRSTRSAAGASTSSVFLGRLGSLRDRPEDDQHTRLQHRFLVYMAVLMSCGGLVWGTLALVFLTPVLSVIPYGYALATVFNLVYFRQSRNFTVVRFIQVLLSLLLPFTFQWVLGGFHASGAVMLWAMLALVGSLTFSQPRTVVKWLVIYTVLTVISGLADDTWRTQVELDIAQPVQVMFFVVNIVIVSAIVFGLTLYLLIQRETAVTALASASEEISGLQREVQSAKRLGQYTLIEKLGEGGMGVVYKARHAMLRRLVAVKLVPPQKVGEGTLARFEREVQLTSQLTHPNTITIFDYGRTDAGTFYYAMEFLDGADLRAIVDKTGPMPPARVIHVLGQAAAALVEAHAEGLIHRDVKPANIILTEIGRVPDVVKLLDFGLVKNVETRQDSTLTFHGSTAGTPRYMSPEAIADPKNVGPRSDVYALGCVGYFLLTGEDVFTGRTVMEVCGHHLHSGPPRMESRRGESVPDELERLILRCLAKLDSDRTDALDLVRALHELSTHNWATWTDDAARAWWEHYGGDLRAEKHAPVDPIDETVLKRGDEEDTSAQGDRSVMQPADDSGRVG